MTFLLFINESAAPPNEDLVAWAETYGVKGDLRSRYTVFSMIMADTSLSRGALNGDDIEGSSLWEIALAELKTIKRRGFPQWESCFMNYRPASREMLWGEEEESLTALFEGKDMESFLNALVAYYRRRGFGYFAFYHCFYGC